MLDDRDFNEDDCAKIVINHVYPLFGPAHEMSKLCWCHPEELDETTVVHNVMN